MTTEVTDPPKPILVGIVEDTLDTRESLTTLIKTSPGFDCVAACATAEDALRVFPKQKPDAVLMDIQLPGMSGIECIRELKKVVPDIQIIMLTVFEDHEKIFQSLKAGATGYIVKKNQAKLLEAIEDVVHGGAPMSSQIARQVVEQFCEPEPKESPASKLSPRETEVLDQLAEGFLYKEIADKLNISIGTVRVHIRRIYDKLHARNRTEAVNAASGRIRPER